MESNYKEVEAKEGKEEEELDNSYVVVEERKMSATQNERSDSEEVLPTMKKLGIGNTILEDIQDCFEIVLPFVPYEWTHKCQKYCAICVHLPSGWTSENLGKIQIDTNGNVIWMEFRQLTCFLSTKLCGNVRCT